MPFPFVWLGAVVAGVFLTTVFAVFGIALRLLSRTTTEARETVLPGLVSGFRDWTQGAGPAIRRMISPRAEGPSGPDVSVEETGSVGGVRTERLHAHVR
jgi:hypothetical protein